MGKGNAKEILLSISAKSKRSKQTSLFPCWTVVKKGFSTFVEGVCWSVERDSK